MTLHFVTATRLSLAEFKQRSPLMKSLIRIAYSTKIQLRVEPHNQRPLANIFNEEIERAHPDEVLIFIHDDVWIDDWLIGQRLHEALSKFDVVGVAGNTRRTPRQEAWILRGTTRTHDLAFLSGAICHGIPGENKAIISWFGPMPSSVKLLDGVFIASRAGTLQAAHVYFDQRFAFHFYDMDFCRSCELAGLNMGTWPIVISHRSAGTGWISQQWDTAYATYLNKWKE